MAPADETRRDDLTSSDLAPPAGGRRGRRPEAAAPAPEAPAKRGRRDQKAPRVKSKRKTRDQDHDLAGAGETAAPTSAAPRSAPSDLGIAAAAAAASPSVAAAQRPATRDTGAAQAPRSPGRGRTGRRTSRRRSRRLYAAVGGVVVIAGAAVAFEMLQASAPSGPAHQISTPQRIGSYAQAPALAASMKASQVRRTIVTQSNGEASNVVAAVYESSASQPSPGASPGHGSTGPSSGSASPSVPGTAANSQIVLFIGGNLSGTSASSFITSFIGKLPGAVATAAGPLGGEAACVPSAGGNPAECAWADNDTFGLVASPTLGAQALASELRQMRLQVEHRIHQR